MRPAFLAAAAVVTAAPALAQTGLYGISGEGDGPAVLYQINPATGAATHALTLNADGGLLMGLTSLGGELYATWLNNYPGGPPSGPSLGRIDFATGDVTFVSDLDTNFNTQGLASNEAAGLMYTVDNSTLYTIDAEGNLSTVGSTDGIDGRGLAYDDAAGVLYAIDLNDNLYTLDTATGASTLIGAVNIPPTGFDWAGLAFDEATRTLMVVDGVGQNLWSIDTATGAPTLIGANGVSGITGLAWIPAPGAPALLAPIAGLSARRRR